MENKEKNCGSCKFFCNSHCRKRAPVVNQYSGDMWAIFPFVYQFDWCGDFEIRKNEEEEIQNAE